MTEPRVSRPAPSHFNQQFLSGRSVRHNLDVYLQLQVTGRTLERCLAELVDHRDFHSAQADVVCIRQGSINHLLVIKIGFGYAADRQGSGLVERKADAAFGFMRDVILHMDRFSPQLVDAPSTEDLKATAQLRNIVCQNGTPAQRVRGRIDVMSTLLADRMRQRFEHERHLKEAAARRLLQETPAREHRLLAS